MQIDVLLESSGMLVLNKPAGMITQGPRDMPIPEVCELIPYLYPGYTGAHRIDRYTSGVYVCADRQTRAYLQQRWHDVTRKTYLAIIRAPRWSTIVVDTPIEGKSATTSMELLQVHQEHALVRCTLEKNGRKHQIRAHLQSIGSPIVGDRLYKGAGKSARGGQLLHAWKIYVGLGELDFLIQAPTPADFLPFGFQLADINSEATPTIKTIPVPETWDR